MAVAARSPVVRELGRLAEKIRSEWPEVDVEVDLETQEGEDGYLWITSAREHIDAIRVFASGLTNRLWKKTGLHVVPRMSVNGSG